VTYEQFGAHIWRSYKHVKPTFRAIERAIDGMRMAALGKAVRDAKTWADDEQTWANNHAPTDCYRSLYDTWHQAVDLMKQAFVKIDDGLKPLNAAKLGEGGRMLQDAGRMLTGVDSHQYDRCLGSGDGSTTAS